MADIHYVALLRGINVGGNKKVSMEKLRSVFEEMGFHTVKTLLNSGNVLFQTNQTNKKVLAQQIEKKLQEAFGHTISVIIRSIKQIEQLVATNPFKHILITPETRLYVSFLGDTSVPNTSKKQSIQGKDFTVLQVIDGAVCSAITLSAQQGTLDLMAFIEKTYGKNVTTRNWSTVQKILR